MRASVADYDAKNNIYVDEVSISRGHATRERRVTTKSQLRLPEGPGKGARQKCTVVFSVIPEAVAKNDPVPLQLLFKTKECIVVSMLADCFVGFLVHTGQVDRAETDSPSLQSQCVNRRSENHAAFQCHLKFKSQAYFHACVG